MVQILIGDCRETLKTLSDNSVDCIVTSPPYYGLRDYGMDTQIGLESSHKEYVAQLVSVFAECRRILKPEGTCWINLGDTYATQPRKGGNAPQKKLHKKMREIAYPSIAAHRTKENTIPPKNLIGIPWRVALALQDDGWILRQDIIWHKPNPLPESVKDRCTKAHEYVFLFTKSPHYFWNYEKMQEKSEKITEMRNKRSVWSILPTPYSGAHFATMPITLVQQCLIAGCPPKGTVLDPFGGAGTTGLVAQRLGCDAVLCELNPEYAQLAENRIKQDMPMFNGLTVPNNSLIGGKEGENILGGS